MNIVRTVLDHLDQAGTDIAIVSIDDIHAQYETVLTSSASVSAEHQIQRSTQNLSARQTVMTMMAKRSS